MLIDLQQTLSGWSAVAVSAMLILLTAGAVIYWLTYSVRSQVLGKTICRGSDGNKTVSLTFDDGPSPDTLGILECLRRENIKATFFLIGSEVEAHPEIARRIVSDGHDVGNHSFSHPIYLFCTPSRVRDELRRTQVMISDVTGVWPKYSRPPCGVRTPWYFAAAKELGLRTIQWTDAGSDWKEIGPYEIAGRILKTVKSGSIILLHDGDSEGRAGRDDTVNALPMLIDGLAAEGLSIAPLAEMIEECEKGHLSSIPLETVTPFHGD